jgi:CheY-like chemotaxis protein
VKKINKNIPLIICTSIVTNEISTECLKIGFDEFLSKPINFEKFNLTILKYLSIKSTN